MKPQFCRALGVMLCSCDKPMGWCSVFVQNHHERLKDYWATSFEEWIQRRKSIFWAIVTFWKMNGILLQVHCSRAILLHVTVCWYYEIMSDFSPVAPPFWGSVVKAGSLVPHWVPQLAEVVESADLMRVCVCFHMALVGTLRSFFPSSYGASTSQA